MNIRVQETYFTLRGFIQKAEMYAHYWLVRFIPNNCFNKSVSMRDARNTYLFLLKRMITQ